MWTSRFRHILKFEGFFFFPYPINSRIAYPIVTAMNSPLPISVFFFEIYSFFSYANRLNAKLNIPLILEVLAKTLLGCQIALLLMSDTFRLHMPIEHNSRISLITTALFYFKFFIDSAISMAPCFGILFVLLNYWRIVIFITLAIPYIVKVYTLIINFLINNFVINITYRSFKCGVLTIPPISTLLAELI